MRKRFSILLILALVAVSLCACSGKKEEKPAEGADSAQTAEVSDDSPYKLVMVEEPKPSGGGSASSDSATADATTDEGTATADTSDPYKQAAGGGDTSDPTRFVVLARMVRPGEDPYEGTTGSVRRY